MPRAWRRRPAEIGAQLGVSAAAATIHLRALVRGGFLRRTGGHGHLVRAIAVDHVPAPDLKPLEIAWCRANPSRIRAMMALVGDARLTAPQPSLPVGPDEEEAVQGGLCALVALAPGETAEIELPRDVRERRRAYRRISVLATRRWGPGGAMRQATRTGMRLRRLVDAPAPAQGGA